MSDTDEIVREFLVESTENLDQLDRDLVALEKDPQAETLLSSIFRTIHTIKGTSGFLGFNKLESVTHVGESLLSRMRDGELVLNAEITTGLLLMVDAVREMLANIEATGQEGERDYRAVIDSLNLLQTSQPPSTAVEAAPVSPAPPASPPEDLQGEASEADKLLGEILVEKGKTSPAQVQDALDKQTQGDSRRVGEILVEKGSAQPPDVVAALQEQKEIRALAATDSSIRVDVGLLDKLMNLVGELVLARNQILQFSTTQQDAVFLSTTQRLNLITTELQEGVMKTRMQPIGNIWARFPRLVRDLAVSCGKQVRIEMEGKETELDKTLVEAIKDPLTHLVRNAVDHGIETPEKRLACSKLAEGRLFMRAFHEGGQVNIEISDDGAGISLEEVKQKALERGLVAADHATRMSEREILNLIFLPGFSTAHKVTNVSGRGVGMDVVKTNIEKIGGVVDVQSEGGKGTTFKVKIPLTLAIIPALTVTSGGDRYAIPQVSLLELVRLEGEQARKGVEMIHGAPVYRLRGHLLPLVYLRRELKGVVTSHSELDENTDLVDFDMARSKQHDWLNRLRLFLDGQATLTDEQAGTAQDCVLGKWLYSMGLKEFGHIPEMSELEKVHADYHAQVTKILALKKAGQHAQAEQEFRDASRFSDKEIDLLSRVETKVHESQNVNIVVLQADDRQFGLVVDEINDTEEIVVKPLGKQLKGIATFAGATIMGDGRVALILDVLGLAQQARVVTETRDRGLGEKAAAVREGAKGLQTLLLFRNPDGGRMAIPLSLVARLEEFERSAVEKTGRQCVVQYRGEILPLIFLYSTLDGEGRREGDGEASESRDGSGKIQVVVYSEHGRSAGLVVDRILDIVETDDAVQAKLARKGTLGSIVTQGRVTELLDVEAILAGLGSNLGEESAAAGARA